MHRDPAAFSDVSSTADTKTFGSGVARHKGVVCDPNRPIYLTRFQKNHARDGAKKRKRYVRDGTGGRFADEARVFNPLPASRLGQPDGWVHHDDPGNLTHARKLYDLLRQKKSGRMSAFEEQWPAEVYGEGRFRELPLTSVPYLRGELPFRMDGDRRMQWLSSCGVDPAFKLQSESDTEGESDN